MCRANACHGARAPRETQNFPFVMKTTPSTNHKPSHLSLLLVALLPACLLFAQATPPVTQPGDYPGHVITGELVKQGAANMAQLANAPAEPAGKSGKETHPKRWPLLRPPLD